ncbi:MAG TPA: SRPBCC family protein [Steroidobacteraceae bacterium]|nr:SRPBCC family protein [Steroidobacteraceae bacterium]
MDKHVESSIKVNVPVRTAYNQWTQFEDFPHFMEGVREIRQMDDQHTHWVAEIGGKDMEWDAEITEQIPDQRVAWRSVTGKPTAGRVDFRSLGASETEVRVRMDYEPEGAVEKIGSFMKAADMRVKGDLKRFKEFIEERGAETGAWRGEFKAGQKRSDG